MANAIRELGDEFHQKLLDVLQAGGEGPSLQLKLAK
jgi:hypothetical protein